MRLQITLASQANINLPKSYNYILQSLIYTLLDPVLRKFLHNEGYKYEKRKFKLFTFSRLTGRFKDKGKNFEFIPPIKFLISSPKDEILQSLAEGLLKKEKLLLGQNNVFIEAISVMPRVDFDRFKGEMFIKILSPLTIYSTLRKSDGAKKTYYYSPFEEEFNFLIKENLRKKYELVFGEKCDRFDFEIHPYKVRPSDEKVIIYKKTKSAQSKPTVIKGWMGLYKLKAAPQIFELSYDCGLGAKNSQGFGCWKVFTYE